MAFDNMAPLSRGIGVYLGWYTILVYLSHLSVLITTTTCVSKTLIEKLGN